MSGDIGIGRLCSIEAKRDAIHVAVAPVVAIEVLHPGQHIGLATGVSNKVTSRADTLIGIVDPFLQADVQPEETFWMFLYPGTITSLRHDWTHPALQAMDVASQVPGWRDTVEPEHRRWIDQYAESVGLGYSELMEGAAEFLQSGEYLVRGGLLEGVKVDGEFWEHYEAVTGTTVADNEKISFFSCSC